MLELRDIEDELLTLLRLFDRQFRVISSMHKLFLRSELRDQTVNGRLFLGDAVKKLKEYEQRASKMLERVRSARDDYDKLMELVQRQAQVDEVRLSRLHADLAGAQGRSVIILTTFTIIFLPLSFFTGLFGMSSREWEASGSLSLKTIAAISLPASFILVASSLVIAFSTKARLFLRNIGRQFRQIPWSLRALVRSSGLVS